MESRAHPPVRRLCRHCSALTETTAERCPRCGRRYSQRRYLPVLIAAAALAVLIVAGWAFLVLKGASDTVNQVRQGISVKDQIVTGVESLKNKESVTPQQFKDVPIGISKGTIERRFGTPGKLQNAITRRLLHAPVLKSSCLYYRDQSDLLSVFRFCFKGDRLVSKMRL
jgi:hypothetical protein